MCLHVGNQSASHLRKCDPDTRIYQIPCPVRVRPRFACHRIRYQSCSKRIRHTDSPTRALAHEQQINPSENNVSVATSKGHTGIFGNADEEVEGLCWWSAY